MGILPENKPKDKNITPRIYLIWGESMSGKTYLAKHFPNPVILNTDGNAKKITTPSVEIKKWENFVQAIKELQTDTEFETVVIDLVDDIKTMLDTFIIDHYNKKENKNAKVLADIPYGGGFSQSKDTFKNLMIIISRLDKNVIFISHSKSGADDVVLPALEEKYLNMVMGRCDVVIRARKIGKNHLYSATHVRDKYTKEDIKDKRIKEVLENVKDIFPTENKKLEIKKVEVK